MTKSTAQILNSSRSSLMTHMMDLDMVSNNLANINTNAFKNSRANFQEVLNLQTKSGVQVKSTQMDETQGAIRISTNALDVAIEGNGFFAVTLPDNKTAYTRDGQFTLDSASNIVTHDGLKLVWQGTVPPAAEEVRVDPNGAVMTRIGNTWTQSGTINLTRFPNPSGLTAYGNSLYLAAPVAGTAQTGVPGSANFGKLTGYALEGSNVDMAQEMTHMISLQRAFQISASVLQQTDTMMSEAIRMRR
jgi:flagellar basal-body rod protein FlgG